jgi:plastocyanin
MRVFNVKILLLAFLPLLFSTNAVLAAEPVIVEHKNLMDHGDGHLMDMDGGMIMGQNKDKLPAGCNRISEDKEITVHAGRKYSKQFPGTMFGFDQHEWKIKPCTRLTIHFVNEDNVRHQWMMHGLPKFMYDKGMFHLELTGPGSIRGTLILPAEDRTYLVHCDIAQHMEKGMKGQLVVGKGSGFFPTIPGITDPAILDDYSGAPLDLSAKAKTVVTAESGKGSDAVSSLSGANPGSGSLFSGSLILGLLAGFAGTPWLLHVYRTRYLGQGPAQILGSLAVSFGLLVQQLVNWLLWLVNRILPNQKFLPKR